MTVNNDKADHLPILDVDAILAAKDLVEETIDIPEWGGAVKVRSFSKKQQQDVRDEAMVDGDLNAERLEMFLFLRGVVEPEFENEQYEQLREKNAAVIDRILNRIMKLSGLTPEAVKEAEKSLSSKS